MPLSKLESELKKAIEYALMVIEEHTDSPVYGEDSLCCSKEIKFINDALRHAEEKEKA